jgi:hypothetical protein
MNEFERMRQMSQRIKATYPPGTRIELIHMSDPYAPIQTGTRGTVKYVDDMGTVFPDWDDGRSLGVCLEEDSIRKLTPEEVESEQMVEEENEDMSPPTQSM